MVLSVEADDTEVPGLIVYNDADTKKSRIWLFDTQEEVEVYNLNCKTGDWFICTKVDNQWKYEPSKSFIETRVDGWRVDIKIPVMMYRTCANDLNFTTSVKLANTLFSPVVGRVGIFMNTDRFRDGVVYEVWATNIPNEQEHCRILKQKSNVFWMVGAQHPVNDSLKLDKYDALCSCFLKIPGVAIKIISNTVIIKTRNFGLCIAPTNDDIKRGDRVDFLPIITDLKADKRYVFAGNCVTTKRNYMNFMNDFDNEFWVRFVPKKEGHITGEYEVAPFGTILDLNNLVEENSIDKLITGLVRFRLVVEEMSISFFFKEVKNAEVTVLNKLSGLKPSSLQTSSMHNINNNHVDYTKSDAKLKLHGFNELRTPNNMHTSRNTDAQANESKFVGSAGTSRNGIPSVSTSAANEEILQNGGSSSMFSFSNKSTLTGTKEEIGVVAAQTVDAYYVFSPDYARDIFLPKHLPEFETEDRAMNVGQWISFTAQSNAGGDRVTILSFVFIDPLFPTMPSFNTIILECKITIPDDYSPQLYGGTVKSEFIPVVGDQDFLIRKCHHGKTLYAVMRRTKTSIPNVFWNIEYIKF